MSDLIFTSDTLRLDFDHYNALKFGQPIRLTRTEWALLRELARHQNQVLPHLTLLQRVWGHEYAAESDYVHTYISRLRRKLEPDPHHPQFILTEQGIGYRFVWDQSPIPPSPLTPPTHHASPHIPIVNPLPQSDGDRYVGRTSEQKLIRDLLQQEERLISLYGRAGIGKTALACKTLSSLFVHDLSYPLAGMISLSATSTGINISRIFQDMAHLLQDSSWDHPHDRIQQRVTALLNRLQQAHVILLLDNLEDLQDSLSGELTDPQLQTFFQIALEQAPNLHLIVTSRERLKLPRSTQVWERVIQLEEGLSIPDSVELLRRSDLDGLARIRDAAESDLAQIAALTRGFPRALEAVVGLLLEDHLLDVPTLIRDAQTLSGEIQEVLVAQALTRLNEEALRLLQLIATYKLPITQATLHSLRPDLSAEHLRAMLNRLVKSRFLHYRADDQTFSMHEIDSAYCYQSMAPDMRDEWHGRIAVYHAEQQEPQLHIRHLVWAGQYDLAAERFLNLADRQPLNELLPTLIEQVSHDGWRLRLCLIAGDAARRAAQLSDAERHYVQGQQLAEKMVQQMDLSAAMIGLGWVYYDRGLFRVAHSQWERAIELLKPHGESEGLGYARGGMGWVSYLLGDYDKAILAFEEAQVIFKALDNPRQMAVNRGDLGVVYMAQKRYAEAIEQLESAHKLADLHHASHEASYIGRYLMTAYVLTDELTQAQDIGKIIVQQDDAPMNYPIALAIYGIVLARLGQSEQASGIFGEAIVKANELLRYTHGLYHVRYARALAMAGVAFLKGGDLAEAIYEYGAAKAVCGEPGVLEMQKSLVEALAKVNPAMEHDLLALLR